jgi:hypothetical protein
MEIGATVKVNSTKCFLNLFQPEIKTSVSKNDFQRFAQLSQLVVDETTTAVGGSGILGQLLTKPFFELVEFLILVRDFSVQILSFFLLTFCFSTRDFFFSFLVLLLPDLLSERIILTQRRIFWRSEQQRRRNFCEYPTAEI